MKKYLSLMTVAVLVLSLLTGCVGTPVVIQDCTCPSEEGATPDTPNTPVTEGSVKTGLAVITTAGDSTSALGDTEGNVTFDNTMVAVNVDDDGVITACVIDSIPATVSFDTTGTITSNPSSPRTSWVPITAWSPGVARLPSGMLRWRLWPILP